jgi:chromate transporter
MGVTYPVKPTFGEAVRLWLKIGCIGFGGPSGQISILQAEVVEKRGWINEAEFLGALQFCMLLPGPEAQQLATYLGWRLHGIRGGIAAGVLFLLPAVLLLWVLSLLYVTGRDWPLLHFFFDGLKPAVVAIVASALLRIGRRTVTNWPLALIAMISFGLFQAHIPYPVVVLGFGLIGGLLLKKPSTLEESPEKSASRSRSWISSCLSSLSMALSILAIWLLPMLVLLIWLGSNAMPFRVGLFFGKVAVLSFGGAYAALSYVSLHASGDWGWLSSGEMLDGLGLAETTPGPLLIALQFVAFLGCYKAPGILSPLFSATLGSLAAVWSLFLPSFLWIFSLAPHLEGIARNPRMAGALAAIGAVVTAVITCLALWFSEALFLPAGHFAALPLILALISFLLLQAKKVGVVPLILICGIVNVLIRGIAPSFWG